MPSLFEDEYYDIIGKARHGLGISARETAGRAGVSEDVVRALESDGRPREADLAAVAKALELSPEKLADFALHPEPPREREPEIPFARLILGAGFSSNGYLIACPASREGLIVDPGADPDKIIAGIERLKMKPVGIVITHSHFDHVGALRDVQERFPVPAVALKAERRIPGASSGLTQLVGDGHEIAAGGLRGRLLHVPGHTAGSAVAAFAETGVAFTGDAMFARSLGRSAGSGATYARFRAEAQRNILGLPAGTILCPGHGPLTTVGDEKRLNPFFA